MSRLAANAATWSMVYEAFASINFGAYDYNTIKASLIDYIKLNFPETFNDFIETSEIIVIIENFAYIAELCAYRIDVSAHENFLSTAQRREAVLRLAKFISYTASRPLPARGLVKISSVRTTENVIDSYGTNITNVAVRWNDSNNANWKDQFLTIINRALQQQVGYVKPSDRFQVQDVLFELYHMNNTSIPNGIIPYSVTLPDRTLPFELVPVAYDEVYNIIEQRPQNKASFTILYGQDGLGDSSETTGFFLYTKQGTMRKFTTQFDGITPNQTYVLPTADINDIDIWVNNIDPATGVTLQNNPSLETTKQPSEPYGEWKQVDTVNAQNIAFNTLSNRNKYEVETLVSNQVRLLFGDGEFADIPSGTFDIWARVSADSDYVVPRNTIVDKTASIPYQDSSGKNQTLTITFSLINALQNASASETIEHIRRNAPAVYYSQDRMTNDADYNTFMLQDPTILKLQSNCRTFAGDSKYITWHDARGAYENVKVFSTDGAIYFNDKQKNVTTPIVDINTLISTYITPILSTMDMYVQITSRGTPSTSYRKLFNNDEIQRLTAALTPPSVPVLVDMYYNINDLQWYAIKRDGAGPAADPAMAPGWPDNYITTPLIKITQTSTLQTSYLIEYVARNIVCHSNTVNFWNVNVDRTINYDTLESSYDTITLLQANVNCNRDSILQRDVVCNIISQRTYDSGSLIGQVNPHSLDIVTQDNNNDSLPDGIDLNVVDGLGDLIMPKLEYTLSEMGSGIVDVTLPVYYVVGAQDITIRDKQTGEIITAWWSEDVTVEVSNKIQIDVSEMINNDIEEIVIHVNEYVYFSRETVTDQWIKVKPTVENIKEYVVSINLSTNLKTRFLGRDSINFEWVHITPSYHLTDPSPSNIIDTYVITKGYYMSLKSWVDGDTTTPPPAPPTPIELRVAYGSMLKKKMISDSVVMHPGKIKLLFGDKAPIQLRAKFKVIRSSDRRLTDNQIKNIITSTVRNFFNIELWEFGETFYFTELATAIHNALPTEISSIVLVPILQENHFGTMFEVTPSSDEIFYCDIMPEDIELVSSYTETNINIGM